MSTKKWFPRKPDPVHPIQCAEIAWQPVHVGAHLDLFCIVAGNATLVFYGPSLVKEAGVADPRHWAGSCPAFSLMRVGRHDRNGWPSDKAQEVRWHTAIAVFLGAAGLVDLRHCHGRGSLAGVVVGLALSAARGTMGAIPVFWKLPSFYMSGTAIVAGLAIINSIANLAAILRRNPRLFPPAPASSQPGLSRSPPSSSARSS